MVQAWHADPARVSSSNAERALVELLDPNERRRLAAFQQERDRLAFLAAHVLLRAALSQAAPAPLESWRFRIGQGGRPVVEAPALHRNIAFSLSHASGCVAVAVCADAEVGIDVEHVASAAGLAEVRDQIVAEEEMKALRQLPQAARRDRLLALWTLKEAYLKARGVGLSVPLGMLSFRVDEEGGDSVTDRSVDEQGGSWRFVRHRLESHRIAVAFRSRTGTALGLRIQEAVRLTDLRS